MASDDKYIQLFIYTNSDENSKIVLQNNALPKVAIQLSTNNVYSDLIESIPRFFVDFQPTNIKNIQFLSEFDNTYFVEIQELDVLKFGLEYASCDTLVNSIDRHSNPFNNSIFPSYGNTDLGFFRLAIFSGLPDYIQGALEKLFWESIYFKVENRNIFENVSVLGSGWEFIAEKQNEKVIKHPSNIFPEVSNILYGVNIRKSYAKLLEIYGKKYLAKTEIIMTEDAYIVQQDFIDSDFNNEIDLSKISKKIRYKLVDFLTLTLHFLVSDQWVPDFQLKLTNTILSYNNFILDKYSGNPKIIDFTYYYDPFRMFPGLTYKACKDSYMDIINIINILKKT